MLVETNSETRATPRSAVAVFERLSGVLSRALAALARKWRIRRDLDRLVEFDDAMLRDIGLARSDIEATLRYGRVFRDAAASSER